MGKLSCAHEKFRATELSVYGTLVEGKGEERTDTGENPKEMQGGDKSCHTANDWAAVGMAFIPH